MASKEKTKTTTLDLSGARLELDGDEYYLESGTLTLTTDYLYGPSDNVDNPIEKMHMTEIEAETVCFEVDADE